MVEMPWLVWSKFGLSLLHLVSAPTTTCFLSTVLDASDPNFDNVQERVLRFGIFFSLEILDCSKKMRDYDLQIFAI